MAHATDVVGYSYDAALHCVDCTKKRYPAIDDLDTLPGDTFDYDGNEVHPVFNGEDAYQTCCCCSGEGSHEIEGPKCQPTTAVDCDKCSGSGSVSECCDDCGEELVS